MKMTSPIREMILKNTKREQIKTILFIYYRKKSLKGDKEASLKERFSFQQT
jgi:hypothetical protein